jgi:hypothetical protein
VRQPRVRYLSPQDLYADAIPRLVRAGRVHLAFTKMLNEKDTACLMTNEVSAEVKVRLAELNGGGSDSTESRRDDRVAAESEAEKGQEQRAQK